MKYYRIIVKDNENSPTSYVYIATLDENNGLSRINGLEVAETVVHSKIKELTNAFLKSFLEDIGAEQISIILKDIRQKLNGYDIQIEKLSKLEDKVDEKINSLIDGAPEALDTLKELSEALNNNSNSDFGANIIQELADKVDKEANKGLSSEDYTNDEKTKLADIEENANNYTHPSYIAHDEGLYKITVDSQGHITGVTAVAKADITGLGIPAQDTIYTHPTYTARTSGLYKIIVNSQGHITEVTIVAKADITGLGIPDQDTTYEVVSKNGNGLAPQLPNETTTMKYLRQDGTWAVPPNSNANFDEKQDLLTPEQLAVVNGDVFDSEDYYTKAETDEAISSAIAEIEIPEESDLSGYYTKTETDGLLTGKINAETASNEIMVNWR